MTLLLAVLLQATPAAPLHFVALRVETAGVQQRLVLEADAEWGPVAVQREGDEVVAALTAKAAAGLQPPPVLPPLKAVRIVEKGATLEVRVSVAPDVPFEVQRNGRQLVVSFGAKAPMLPEGLNPELLELYRSLQPPRDPALQALRDAATFTTTGNESDAAGFGIGPLRFQPALVIGYARTDTTIETPTPERDSFFQVEPRLGSHITLFDGRVRATYEPQLRMNSRFAKINRPSHELTADLEIPFASRFVLRGREHLSISTLDAVEVDPGREYFFDLGRFTHNDVRGSLQMEVGPRLSLVGGAGMNHVQFKEQSGFFSYDQTTAHAGVEFMLTESARTRLGYGYEHTPPARTRPIVESEAHSVQFSLGGELFPLMTTDVSVGYRRQESPRAGKGGERFDGVTLSGTISKEFTRRTRLSLTGGRQVLLSSFETNAFYISNSVETALSLTLPLGLSGRVGGGYHWNAYRTVATGLGEPRHDRLYGWTAGVSRPLSRWSYLRFDYAWDRRDSNVDALDTRSSMMLIQLGIGFFEAAAPTPTQ
jgi:hypothetical protein